uniref:Uncharacterized protein n=1 Tax=Avena sativa TaxID=4498 RepID=A0ACD5V6Q8_AVESA
MASAAGDGGGSVPPQTTKVEACSVPEAVTPGFMTIKECVGGISAALKNPMVRFLREKMDQAGCPVWPLLIQAVNCNHASGGYNGGRGITVCCNQMRYQDMIEQVLIHELIHAYDDCVGKNIDWKNCGHHACSEIRANHLSGNCHYKREMLKGFLKIRGHEPECVKRRALLSVKQNPNCSDTAAKDAIEAVWDICYNDTRPFDRAP